MKNEIKYKQINSTNVRNNDLKLHLTQFLLKTFWLVMPNIIDRLILKLFFSPQKYPINPNEKKLLDEAESFIFRVHQNYIKGWKWGEGPAVIFAHGWNGSGIQISHYIRPLIQNGFSVITFDAPAHGQSEGQFTNYFEITDTIRKLWQYGKKENVYAVAGHSLGAAALLNFISKEKFDGKIVLFSPPLKLKEMLFQTFDQHGVPKIIYQTMIQDLESKHGYNLYYDNPACLIKKIKQPVFIVHDSSDRTVPYADSEHCAQRFPNITLQTTRGLGHRRILGDPSVLNAVLNFLQNDENTEKDISKAS